MKNESEFIIERASESDTESIAEIYDGARRFMRSYGNMKQWTGGYPAPEDSRRDMERGELYVAKCEGAVAAVFCYMTRPEPTYEKIYDGEWINEAPYSTIHRIAVSDKFRGRGVAAKCFEFAAKKFGCIRADTHRDNKPMQRALEKFGFKYCGVIYLESGDPRLAYQYIKE